MLWGRSESLLLATSCSALGTGVGVGGAGRIREREGGGETSGGALGDSFVSWEKGLDARWSPWLNEWQPWRVVATSSARF